MYTQPSNVYKKMFLSRKRAVTNSGILKRHLRLELKEPNICNTEMVMWIIMLQQNDRNARVCKVRGLRTEGEGQVESTKLRAELCEESRG